MWSNVLLSKNTFFFLTAFLDIFIDFFIKTVWRFAFAVNDLNVSTFQNHTLVPHTSSVSINFTLFSVLRLYNPPKDSKSIKRTKTRNYNKNKGKSPILSSFEKDICFLSSSYRSRKIQDDKYPGIHEAMRMTSTSILDLLRQNNLSIFIFKFYIKHSILPVIVGSRIRV